MCPTSGEVQREATTVTSQELAEVLSSMNQSSVGVTVSSSHEGFGANASDRDGNSRSDGLSDELTMSDLDSTKRAKVAVAAATTGMTFNCGCSTVGKARIQAMEGLRYFAKGSTRALGAESILKPRVDEAVVFEDFFIAGFHMPPHTALADILQKFKVQLHQLIMNAIVQLSKFLWAVTSCGGRPTSCTTNKRSLRRRTATRPSVHNSGAFPFT
jgi:hypothetical protein